MKRCLKILITEEKGLLFKK